MLLRLLILLAANFLLLWLVVTINVTLTAWQFTLYFPALFLVFPGLNLKPAPAILCALITGFCFDAAYPVPFGLHAVLFTLAAGGILQFRRRLHREKSAHRLYLTHALNGLLVVGFSIAIGREFLFYFPYWVRVLSDLAVSHLLLLILAPWFFSLQLHALEWGGIQIYQDEIENEVG